MLPEINTIPTNDSLIRGFEGLNQTEKCQENEFSDMQGMFSDEAPYLAPRKNRVVRLYEDEPNNHYGDIVYGEDYYSIHRDYVDSVPGYFLYKNFEMIIISDNPLRLKDDFRRRQIVKFGASLFIYPDNILYNPQDNTVNELNYSYNVTNESNILYLSDKEGVPFISDDVTTLTVGEDTYPGGFDYLLSRCRGDVNRAAVSTRIVDIRISTALSNSVYRDSYCKYLGLKHQTYISGDPTNLNKVNLCFGESSDAKVNDQMTTYPCFWIKDEEGVVSISQYNSAQSAWLPVQQYISYRITLSEYEKLYSKVKIGDYIKLKALKSNNTEYTAADFINSVNKFNLINYLQSGVKVENIIKSNNSVVFVFADKDFIKAIQEVTTGFVIKGLPYPSSENPDHYIKTICKFENYFYAPGGGDHALCAKLKITKEVPDMDYITVSANRIWGCSSDNHEIYACKQGDASCWYNYAGLASDSYAVTIANEEDFTGAVTLNETPYFFKENMAYAIFGNKPKNYQVQQIKCRGVEKNAYLSISQKDGYVYYKSTEGIERFNGNNSQSLTDNLKMEQLFGRNSAIGHDKYFVFLMDSNEIYNLYVFDIKRGMWHIEDKNAISVHSLVNIDGNVYLFKTTEGRTASDYVVERLTDIAKEKNNLFDDIDITYDKPTWYVVSGEFNADTLYNKYITKLMFEMKIQPGSNVKISFSYNDEDDWETVFKSTDRHTKRTIKVPITPKRCERMKYRIEGEGQAKIYSILMTIEGGSEIDGTEKY